MSKNITEIPYTEMVERGMSIARVNPNAIERFRGLLQDIYTRDIPMKHDWQFLFVSSAITTTAEFKTGNASATTDSAIVTFSSDATITSDMVGRKIKFSGNDVVYKVDSFISAQSIQILPPLNGATNLTSVSYSIFQPIYALASNFDRFPKGGGLYRWSGNEKEILPEEPYQEYTENYSGSLSIPEKVILVGMDTAGNPLLELRPAPKDARVYSYDYLKRLPPMMETTANLLRGVSAQTTAVSFIGTTQFTEVNTDSATINYFRVDVLGKGQDSQWYPVLGYTGNSALTLRSVFANSAITSSANYTIAEIPKMPSMLHTAILYGAVAETMMDQGDEKAAIFYAKYAQVLSDAKRIYVTRVYVQDIHGIQEEWDYRR